VSEAAPAPSAKPARRPPPLSSRSLRRLLAVLGLAFVAWLLWDLGPTAVWSVIRALGWRVIALLFVPYVMAVALDTVGWDVLLPGARVGWPALTGARLAGEAVNLATPTASVGGEPLKAFLVRDRVPLATALASVIVDKTTVVVGQTLLVAAGFALAALALETPRALRLAMAVLLGAQLVGTGGFALVQLRGGVAGAGRILQRLGVERPRAIESCSATWTVASSISTGDTGRASPSRPCCTREAGRWAPSKSTPSSISRACPWGSPPLSCWRR